MVKKNFGKIFISYLLMIFLPCMLSLSLYILILNKDNKHELENNKIIISDMTTDFLAKTTPIAFYKPYFDELNDKIINYKKGLSDVHNLTKFRNYISGTIKEYSHNLNDDIRCAVFNENSELLNIDDLQDFEQRYFSFLWKKSNQDKDADYETRMEDQGLITSTNFNSDIVTGQSELCIQAFGYRRVGVLYLKKTSSKSGGVIIFVNYKRTGFEFIKDKIKELPTNNQPIILYSLEKKEKTISNCEHIEIPFNKTLDEEFLNGFKYNGFFWKGFNADDYKLLLGLKIDKYKINYNAVLIISLLFIILVLSSIFFFKNFYYSKGIFFSIRYKLIIIFSIAVYIPSLGLWVLSYTSLFDHRLAVENKVKEGMLDIFNQIDDGYKLKEEALNEYYEKMNDYIINLKGKSFPNKEEFENTIQSIIGKNNKISEIFNWLEILAIDKTKLYKISRTDTNYRMKNLENILTSLFLNKFCSNRLAHMGKKTSQSEILVENILENPMVGLSYILERPKQLISQEFEVGGVYWWWNYYSDIDNPAALLMANSITDTLSLSYFNSLKNKRFNIGNIGVKLTIYNYFKNEFIPDLPDKNDFYKIINVSNLNKTLESAIINYNNSKYLCLCKPMNKLHNCFYICMYPLSEIVYQTEKARRAVYVVIILLLIISVFIGLLLSKNFIIPINELNKGLEALKNRETEITVNIDNKDELGHLGHAFNLMMFDIKDMLLAGAVQQCLIPSGKYNIENYDCIIYNKMATDLGGDYADIFDLPNEKLLITIGSVSGNGVSSSLLVVMVKASIFMFANQNYPLNEIVSNTNIMIQNLLKEKKSMKFCAITLDKNTGELAICNAGNPYPIIKTNEKCLLRTPNQIGLPLGVSQDKYIFSCEKEEIKTHELLFLYTEGLIKLRSSKCEEFGYDNLKSFFKNIQTDDLEEMKNQLISNLKEHYREKELLDDITFILLRRNSPQNN